jgi:hypothetical protein
MTSSAPCPRQRQRGLHVSRGRKHEGRDLNRALQMSNFDQTATAWEGSLALECVGAHEVCHVENRSVLAIRQRGDPFGLLRRNRRGTARFAPSGANLDAGGFDSASVCCQFARAATMPYSQLLEPNAVADGWIDDQGMSCIPKIRSPSPTRPLAPLLGLLLSTSVAAFSPPGSKWKPRQFCRNTQPNKSARSSIASRLCGCVGFVM